MKIPSQQIFAVASSPVHVARNTKKKKEPGFFKEECRGSKMLCLGNEKNCCYDSCSNKNEFSSRRLNKRTFERSGDRPKAKYRKFLEETGNVKPTKAGFRKKNHSIVTYEHTKKGLSYFMQKR